jgi:hypothetical protein
MAAEFFIDSLYVLFLTLLSVSSGLCLALQISAAQLNYIYAMENYLNQGG